MHLYLWESDAVYLFLWESDVVYLYLWESDVVCLYLWESETGDSLSKCVECNVKLFQTLCRLETHRCGIWTILFVQSQLMGALSLIAKMYEFHKLKWCVVP